MHYLASHYYHNDLMLPLLLLLLLIPLPPPQITPLADPCPLADSERRGSLKTKETLLYAPMANVGAVRFDSDALYIDLRQINYTKVRHYAIITCYHKDGDVMVYQP